LTEIPFAGIIAQPVMLNRALSPTEMLSLYESGSPDTDDFPTNKAGTSIYTSDFSAGVDSWQTGAGRTVAGNVDGINGQNDWLSATNDSNTVANAYRPITWGARRVRVAYRVFIPAGSPITAIQTRTDTAAGLSTPVAANTQYDISYELTVGTGTVIRVDADTSSAAGTVFYIRGMTITPIGAVFAPDAVQPGAGSTWYDMSAVAANLTIPVGVSWRILNKGLPVGGLMDLLNGQIKFPATQNPSSDVNTLDDYEEGTFTVTLLPGTSGSITLDPAYATARYTKIGRVVSIQGVCVVQSISSPVGTLKIGGLPFASGNAVGNYAAIALQALSLETTATMPGQGAILPNSSVIDVFTRFAGGAGGITSNAADIRAGTEIRFSGTYSV
jgi:hypothetical protein